MPLLASRGVTSEIPPRASVPQPHGGCPPQLPLYSHSGVVASEAKSKSLSPGRTRRQVRKQHRDGVGQEDRE